MASEAVNFTPVMPIQGESTNLASEPTANQ